MIRTLLGSWGFFFARPDRLPALVTKWLEDSDPANVPFDQDTEEA